MPTDLNEPKTKRTRRLIWGGAGLLIIGAISFYVVRQRMRANEIKFDTVPVQRGRIAARVTATGTLSALITVQVGSQVSGRIAALFADFNSKVKKGQVVAKIDPQFFEAAVMSSRANLSETMANLAKAKAQALDAQRQYDRISSLKSRELVSQAELDTASTNLEATRAQVEVSKGAVAQARATLNQAEINLAYTTIYSPIDGVVISRNVDVGQTVAASMQAPTLFTIAEDLGKMQVHTNVAEADIGKLVPGMTASFTVDAFPTEQFRGSIHDVRNAAQIVQNVVTYDAVLDVQNPELKLRPGMTANVTVIYAQKDDVLTVPNAALRFKPPDSLQGARVATAGVGERPRPADRGGAQAASPQAASPVERRQRGGDRMRDGIGMGVPPNERTIWVLTGRLPQAMPIRIGVSDGTVTEAAGGPVHEGDLVIVGMSGGEVPTTRPAGQPPGGPALRRF